MSTQTQLLKMQCLSEELFRGEITAGRKLMLLLTTFQTTALVCRRVRADQHSVCVILARRIYQRHLVMSTTSLLLAWPPRGEVSRLLSSSNITELGTDYSKFYSGPKWINMFGCWKFPCYVFCTILFFFFFQEIVLAIYCFQTKRNSWQKWINFMKKPMLN